MMLLEALLAFCCCRGLGVLSFDALSLGEHPRGAAVRCPGRRWGSHSAHLSPSPHPWVRGLSGCPAELLSWQLPRPGVQGGFCVPALKPESESVVMRFYDVFWQGLVILCVDLLYNERSDFEMFCATIFWKGHCILFMGMCEFL